MPTRRKSRPLGWAVVFWVVACGGSQTSGPRDPASQESGSAGEYDSDGASSGAATDEPSLGSYCHDGTCFACGQGICPAGYYCDESGEPACSWLPKCATEPSCGCVTGRLGASCSCEERDGGIFVRCD